MLTEPSKPVCALAHKGIADNARITPLQNRPFNCCLTFIRKCVPSFIRRGNPVFRRAALFFKLLLGVWKPSTVEVRLLFAQRIRDCPAISAGVNGVHHGQGASRSEEQSEEETDQSARKEVHRCRTVVSEPTLNEI